MSFINLRLQSFRSYHDDSFEFDPGVNIIVGPNASGKTSLLEALQVLSIGSSFRAGDTELLQTGADWARLDSLIVNGSRTVKLRLQPSGIVKKEYVLDDHPYKRLSHQKNLPVVLFEPDHLRLLNGVPDGRRNFMDDLLELLEPNFAGYRKNYRRALLQRNSLLKHGNPRQDMLFVWNLRLSELGGKIAEARIRLLERFNAKFGDLYESIAHSSVQARVVYYSKCSLNPSMYGSEMLKKLERDIDTDIARGFTGTGVHRDDMVVSFGDTPINQIASRGEVRTLLLSFKILELHLLEEVYGRPPVLLLDDVFSELDGARRRALTEVISGYQTFITTTDADVVVQHFMNNCRIIPTSGN